MENDKKKLEFDMFKKQKEMELEKEKEEQKKKNKIMKKNNWRKKNELKKKLIYDCNKKDLQLQKKKK